MFYLNKNNDDIHKYGELALEHVKGVSTQWIEDGRSELLPSYDVLEESYRNFYQNLQEPVDNEVTARMLYYRTFVVFFPSIVASVFNGMDAVEKMSDALQDRVLLDRIQSSRKEPSSVTHIPLRRNSR